ncbi:SEA (Seh1-associated) complex subunit [Pseudocyphellaria aurata]|nr:SEA (Seh1-associated) complex subunit [Pseudocyphellaria aurata]
MSTYGDEDPSAVATAPATTVLPPPAPPLLPSQTHQQYGFRAANALVRFAQPFIYGSRPPSANGDRPTDSSVAGITPSDRNSSSHLASKITSHHTGIPIAALDISPSRTHAILAGRDILKTVHVSGSACVEDFNLRSAIIAHAATRNAPGGAISATHKDQLSSNDVKWSHGKFDTTVATAGANGQIVIYDLNRVGVECARLHEHVRQVHRVAFNPHQGAWLLSGSQDATIRFWDLRSLAGDRSVMTCRSQDQYPGNNEGIRDLKWSPTNGVEFAVGTDNGVIQCWDIRRDKAPTIKVNAHEKTCHSIDWHADGKHLVSGGADKNVNIWDFSSTDRRKKPCWQLRAPQSVLNVRWRPPFYNAEDSNSGNWQCTQLITSYDNQDPRVHLWDFCHQSVPLREIDRYETAPTAMLWHSENLLWSTGGDGIFTQTDINFVPKVSDRRSPNVVAIAPNGQISFFSEKKPPRRRRSLQDAADEFLNRNNKASTNGEKLSGSHSVTDGSLEEPSLLSSSFKNRHRKSRGARPSKSLASTPPAASSGAQTPKFDDAMHKDLLFHHAQDAASGRILGLFDDAAFRFLAQYSRTSVISTDSPYQFHQALCTSFQQNADLAAQVNQYQLAQSWRILGLAVEKGLKSCSNDVVRDHVRSSLYLDPNKRSSTSNLSNDMHDISQGHGREFSAPEGAKVHETLKAPLSLENPSNMTTPLARPVPDTSADSAATIRAEVEDEDEVLSLPGPAWEKRLSQGRLNTGSDLLDANPVRGLPEIIDLGQGGSSDELAVSPRSVQLRQGSADRSSSGPAFPDMDHHMSERRAAMENYRVKPRPLLRLDEPSQLPRNLVIPSLDRHDSNESFQLFSASTESSHRANSLAGSLGSSQESERSGRTPERRETPKRRKGGSDKSFRSRADASRDGVLSAGQAVTSVPLDTSRRPALLASTDAFVQLSGCSPLLRPSNHVPPVIHFEDMEPLQNLDARIVEPTSYTDHRDEPTISVRPTHSSTYVPPWAATSLIAPLIKYHTTDLSSSQLPAQLLLQLGSHVPNSVSPSLVIAVLLSYHSQLVSLSLHVQAAHLRNLAHSTYPELSDHGTYGIASGGPWCTVCQRPSKGKKSGYCERCHQKWADCPICDGEGPEPLIHAGGCNQGMYVEGNELRTSDFLWGWCQWCGHGGHVGCLRVWWRDAEVSEGGCATVGCLHDCVAGLRRDEAIKRKAEAKKTGAVRGDDWVVRESRAVERARGLVGAVGGEGAGAPGGKVLGQPRSMALGAGQSPLSIGMMGRSSSGGKKVRLLVPHDDREGLSGVGNGAEAGNRASASVP